MKKFMLEVGYNTIAASKTTKEKFLLDLAGEVDDANTKFAGQNGHDTIEHFLDQHFDETSDSEMFIMADEFNDFFGNGNIEFISLLGNLWDYEGRFENRIKNGKSVSINNPTISILGGNTPTGFSLAFPADVLGQGFFSRILLVYGEPNGKRIAFPDPPSHSDTTDITDWLTAIRQSIHGEASFDGAAKKLANKIYNSGIGVNDVRFDAYSNRRLQHLLKLCLVCSAARLSKTIEERDVIYANTILVHTEHLMPKALGEFGRARNADVSHRVLELITKAKEPISSKLIWKEVSTDLDKIDQLAAILSNLIQADKIQYIATHRGYLPRIKIQDMNRKDDTIDMSLLTKEERGMK